MRFNIIVIALGIVLLSASALFDVNFLNYKKPVPYDQWKTISFYDFTGLKKPGLTLEDVSRFAYIETSREIVYHRNGYVSITAYFYPARSYVFDAQIRNPDLLRHELCHFHITEYFARLLRKDILSSPGQISRDAISILDEKYYQLEREMQLQYDEETDHSYVMQAQKRWEQLIEENLKELASYASPTLRLKK